MIIKIKSITHERTEDAPFIGALICAIDCKFNCVNCFNQHLKNLPTIEIQSSAIIEMVKSNPFNQGIILGGLEWTLQPNELRDIIKKAFINDLKVILYTGLDEDIFMNTFADIYNIKGIYIKFGRYKDDLKTQKVTPYGVVLGSSNQYIYKKV